MFLELLRCRKIIFIVFNMLFIAWNLVLFRFSLLCLCGKFIGTLNINFNVQTFFSREILIIKFFAFKTITTVFTLPFLYYHFWTNFLIPRCNLFNFSSLIFVDKCLRPFRPYFVIGYWRCLLFQYTYWSYLFLLFQALLLFYLTTLDHHTHSSAFCFMIGIVAWILGLF